MSDKEFSFENLVFQQSKDKHNLKEPVEETGTVSADSGSSQQLAPTQPGSVNVTPEPKKVPVVAPEIFVEDIPENSRLSTNKPTASQSERFDEPGYAGGYETPGRDWGSYEQTREALKQRDTIQWKLIHGEEYADFLEPEPEPKWVIVEWVYRLFPWWDKKNK